MKPFIGSVRFETLARELLIARDDGPLVNYERLGRDAQLSVFSAPVANEVFILARLIALV